MGQSTTLAWRIVLSHPDGVKSGWRVKFWRRAEENQAARGKAGPNWDAVAQADAGNLAWLRRMVADAGWPWR